jgi:iron complex outermembrane receptor protein
MSDELRTTGVGTPRGWSMGTMADSSALGTTAEATLGSVTFGVEGGRRNWETTTQMAKMAYVGQPSIPDVVTSSVGLFASHARSLAAGLALELGARVDRVASNANLGQANAYLYYAYNSTRRTSATDTLPSAMARLRWAVSSRFELAASIGHTARVPDPAERYFALRRTGTDWVGNPELRPTQNNGVELRATENLGLGIITGSIFYNSLRDFITLHDQDRVHMQPGVMNTEARSYANVDAQMWGAELEFTQALTDHLSLAASASWARGVKDTDPARDITSSNLAEVPPLTSRISVRYDTGAVYAEAEGVFTAAQNLVDSDLQEQATPGWGVLNLKVGRTVNGFRLQAILANAFNRFYSEHLGYVRDPFRTGARVYEPGRTLSFTVGRFF